VYFVCKTWFLFPHDIVEKPYEVTFNKKYTNPISIDELTVQKLDKKLNEYNKIVLVAGKNYSSIVDELFTEPKIETPLEGCKGIGYMMSRLNKLIDGYN